MELPSRKMIDLESRADRGSMADLHTVSVSTPWPSSSLHSPPHRPVAELSLHDQVGAGRGRGGEPELEAVAGAGGEGAPPVAECPPPHILTSIKRVIIF